MTGGIVRDIRTGRAMFKTESLNDTFINQISLLLETQTPFYLVYGRCTKIDSRCLVDDMKSLDAFHVIYDCHIPSDWVLIFAGVPEELGFQVAS